MNCDEADRLMDAYLDGVLELTRQIEIERHLSRCHACQSLAQQCQEFRSFFSANAPTYKRRLNCEPGSWRWYPMRRSSAFGSGANPGCMLPLLPLWFSSPCVWP